MSEEKRLVKDFYERLWNARDASGLEELLSSDVKFRGSLGRHHEGRDGFWSYVEQIHTALGDYRCEILELVAEPGRAMARVRFAGQHRGTLLGVEATEEHIEWWGFAQFTVRGGKIAEVQVLGDVDALRDALARAEGARRLFVYGSLQVPRVLEHVIGRRIVGEPAILPGFRRRVVRGESFPAICPDETESTDGRVFSGLDQAELELLDSFEGSVYERRLVRVQTFAREGYAQTYVAGPTLEVFLTEEPWRLDLFVERDLPAFLERIGESSPTSELES